LFFKLKNAQQLSTVQEWWGFVAIVGNNFCPAFEAFLPPIIKRIKL
jgi:hypothetical protein